MASFINPTFLPMKNKRVITYRSCDNQGKPVPCLPIQGKFLSQFGFSIGTPVRVVYNQGFIHISQIIRSRYGDTPDGAVALKT
jgi:hypothetical protein